VPRPALAQFPTANAFSTNTSRSRALIQAANWLPWLLLLALLGCAGADTRPVLYPNNHLQTVGRAQAERDTDACLWMARQYGAEADKSSQIANKTATGAAVGGASAGAWGLVRGDAGERALAGAAAGAAGGLVSGSIQASQPSSVFKRFVERCMADRGYDVIGWN
jgi:hypothetical protein